MTKVKEINKELSTATSDADGRLNVYLHIHSKPNLIPAQSMQEKAAVIYLNDYFALQLLIELC